VTVTLIRVAILQILHHTLLIDTSRVVGDARHDGQVLEGKELNGGEIKRKDSPRIDKEIRGIDGPTELNKYKLSQFR
jgi:hypothetical protein